MRRGRLVMMATGLAALAAAAVTIPTSGGGAPQNLVVNGDFDLDAAGWSVIPPGTPATVTLSHDPGLDALGAVDSGSLFLEVDFVLPPGFTTATIGRSDQCFLPPDPPDTEMTFGFLRVGEVTEGALGISVCQWENPDCTGLNSCAGFQLATAGTEFEPALTGVQFIPSRQSLSIDLSVSNNSGAGLPVIGSSHLDRIFLVEGTSQTLPALAAEAMATVGQELTVDFLGASSGGIAPFEPRYRWDFGDGNTSEEQNPTHTYAETGTYAVTLTVDSGFEQATDQIQVVVGEVVTEIPVLHPLGAGLLFLLLAAVALARMRRS